MFFLYDDCWCWCVWRRWEIRLELHDDLVHRWRLIVDFFESCAYGIYMLRKTNDLLNPFNHKTIFLIRHWTLILINQTRNNIGASEILLTNNLHPPAASLHTQKTSNTFLISNKRKWYANEVNQSAGWTAKFAAFGHYNFQNEDRIGMCYTEPVADGAVCCPCLSIAALFITLINWY